MAGSGGPASPPIRKTRAQPLERLRLASRLLAGVGIGLAFATWVFYFPSQSVATGALPGLREDSWTALERRSHRGSVEHAETG